MIKMQIGGITCRCSLLFPAFLLVLLRWDRTGLVLFGVSAACLHECGHIVACWLCGKRPVELMVSFFGLRLLYDRRIGGSYGRDLMIAAAGPLINLICAVLLVISGVDTVYVYWHLVMAVFNLLPIEPLDGAVILSSGLLLSSFSLPMVQKILSVVSGVCLCLLILLGVALCVHTNRNASLLIFALYVSTFRLFYKGN